MDSPPKKREIGWPVKGHNSKRSKQDEEEDNAEDAVDTKCTPQEIVEIRKINQLLKQAYKDAPIATDNPMLYNRVCVVPWNEICYDMRPRKSLANRLLNEEGWTAQRMIKTIGSSPMPIGIYPLERAESRALWQSLRFRYHLNELKENYSKYEFEVPEKWLTTKFAGKKFKKNNALDFAKELIALVSFNQGKFLGKQSYWFRTTCSMLGWELSGVFCEYFALVLFVISADPALIATSTSSIEGTWGSSGNPKKVKQAFKKAAKAAEKSKNIKYKETFKLLKEIFPSALK